MENTSSRYAIRQDQGGARKWLRIANAYEDFAVKADQPPPEYRYPDRETAEEDCAIFKERFSHAARLAQRRGQDVALATFEVIEIQEPAE